MAREDRILPRDPLRAIPTAAPDRYGFWRNRRAIRQSHDIDREKESGAG